MTSTKLIPLALLFVGTACASTPTFSQDYSAAAHDRAADEDRASAREHADRYEGRAVRYVELYPETPASCDRSLAGNCSPFWTMTKNPTDRELALAAAYQSRARAHRKAAQALRNAEGKACVLVSMADEDMSPFLRQRDILAVEEIGRSGGRGPLGQPAGAAITFGEVRDLTAQNLQRIVDCHLARNAALGWDQSVNIACPLNVKGAAANVRTIGGRLVVEVTAVDAAAALEIIKRAQALAEPRPVSLR
ncbi:MAG TPA: hypothetical protein VGF45_23075 [Polyangia bacterium]